MENNRKDEIVISKGTIKEFLTFKKMITPMIIHIIFWIGTAICVIGGIVAMTAMSLPGFIGFLLMILGPVIVRIWCELMMVFFRIHSAVEEINNKK